MPCHLIAAHSNSWSSDTDKWTCVITLDFFVTFPSVKMASAQHVTKQQTRAIAISPINLCLLLSTPSLHNLPAFAHHQSSRRSKVNSVKGFVPAVKTRWSFDFFPLLFLCKQLLWEGRKIQGEEGRKWTFVTFQDCFAGRGEGVEKKKLSLKSSRGWHFSFYLFNLFIVSNH